ncbi:MAG: hypothetical protein Q4B43_06720 [Bacteroidota bacterium]|nr:hypothetical protein [Bacteroidota bacterium]
MKKILLFLVTILLTLGCSKDDNNCNSQQSNTNIVKRVKVVDLNYCDRFAVVELLDEAPILTPDNSYHNTFSVLKLSGEYYVEGLELEIEFHFNNEMVSTCNTMIPEIPFITVEKASLI